MLAMFYVWLLLAVGLAGAGHRLASLTVIFILVLVSTLDIDGSGKPAYGQSMAIAPNELTPWEQIEINSNDFPKSLNLFPFDRSVG